MRSIIPTNLSTATPKSETLSRQKILSALEKRPDELGVCPDFRTIKPRFDLHLFDDLPSTSTSLWHMLSEGAGSGTVVIAQQQSCGRGQHGRSWVSEPGGLYLSLALEPDWPAKLAPQLTCLSAWGIATAFNNLGIPVQIKWPNDLFFRGQKLGGILTETKLSHTITSSTAVKNPLKPAPCIKQAVIGVGINWHNRVPHNGISLTKILGEPQYQKNRNKINCLEVLIAIVLRGILQGYYFHQQVGSQVFMKAYQNLLTQVGDLVSIDNDSNKTTRSGKVVGVSEEGYLQVLLNQVPLKPTPSIDQKGNASGPATRDVSRLSTGSVGLDGDSSSISEVDVTDIDGHTTICLIKPGEIHVS